MPDGMSALSARTFWRAVHADEYDGQSGGYEVPLTESERSELIAYSPGVARGAITGGNLALIGATLGTPFEIETAGKILLVEDVDEPPYRIDRFFSQLRIAGKFEDLAGVVVGQFNDCHPPPNRPSLSVAEVLDDYLAPLDVPIVANYPVGHTTNNATLPLGAPVELDANSGIITVLQNPVSVN